MTNLRKTVALLGALVSVVLIVGCSGDDSDSSDKKPASSTTTTTFSGTGGEDFCPALGEVTRQSELLAQDPSSTEAERKQKWDQAVATVNGLAEEAPEEIQSDVAVIASVYGDIREALSQYGYDVNELPQSEQTALVNAEAQQAADRLNLYNQQVCTTTTTTTTAP